MSTHPLEFTALPAAEVFVNMDSNRISALESTTDSAASSQRSADLLARSTDDMEEDDEVGASPDPADLDEEEDEDIDEDDDDEDDEDDDDLDADEEDDEDEDEEEDGSDVLKT